MSTKLKYKIESEKGKHHDLAGKRETDPPSREFAQTAGILSSNKTRNTSARNKRDFVLETRESSWWTRLFTTLASTRDIDTGTVGPADR